LGWQVAHPPTHCVDWHNHKHKNFQSNNTTTTEQQQNNTINKNFQSQNNTTNSIINKKYL
jgi:hypothetical protein